MIDIHSLNTDFQTLLSAVRPWVETRSVLQWRRGDPVLHVVYSAIIRRQFDALEAVVDLVQRGRGYAAAPLLRPACEERIWCKYLRSIDPVHAEKLLMAMAHLETHKLLEAQAAYSSADAMRELGLSAHLSESQKTLDHAKAEIESVGRALGWRADTINNVKKDERWPSARSIAKRVGLEKMYEFLYHGTSRFVHFTGVELLRRAWGRTGRIHVGSSRFSDYWAAFSLCWGFKLFWETIEEVFPDDEHVPDCEAQAVRDAKTRIDEFGMVPLITAEELEWED